MLTVGDEYTRNDIHLQLGGSKVTCLPTVNGVIVAACLTTEFSPAAPHVMLCGTGAVHRACQRTTAQGSGVDTCVRQARGQPLGVPGSVSGRRVIDQRCAVLSPDLGLRTLHGQRVLHRAAGAL